MEKPKKPADEAQRLEALRRLKILDTLPEQRFDRLTRLAQALLGVPMALVSLIDDERQWFKSRQGLDAKETPRDVSFCGHAILGSEPFIIPDATKDARFFDNPLVTSAPNIRFYAGVPLRLSTGETMGTLCVLDRVPRTLDAARIQLLLDLGALVANELEGATLDAALSAKTRSEKRLAAQFAATKALAEATSWRSGLEGVVRGMGSAMGCLAGGGWEVDQASGELYCADFWNASGRSTPFSRQSREIRFKIGAGLPGRTWRDAKPCWLADVTVDPNFPRAATAREDGIRAGLAFPIVLDGKVEGVLEFFDATATEPDAELLSLYTAVGTQLGEFLRRRRADKALRKSTWSGCQS